MVITGDKAAVAAAQQWTPENIARHCGNGTMATLNRRGAGKWAGQVPHRQASLADFLNPANREPFAGPTTTTTTTTTRDSSGGGTRRSMDSSNVQTEGGSPREKGDYLFDFNLQKHCPAVVQELKIPTYVAQDLLQRTPKGTKYREYWCVARHCSFAFRILGACALPFLPCPIHSEATLR